ncbi:diguanylate cyclase (GGDEF)-like protein [Fontibacillus phaseoli]|uniref:Diguanylate cyclase (GGDEF)-like protein n=1 Tax=Fontibacillus phaseoli TaxID=1416533 RepID=A0A369ATD9_9BACL|nr:EAL domain-containing protein [Fontibacillus phaseoli]RCX12491.1 diguanylate cyclase (GGDEF)-like protein [Fontibacillus phaseoli]
MRIRTEERTTIIQGGFGLTVMLGAIWLSAGTGETPSAAESLQTLQLMAGLVSGAVSFAIFTQGWILFTEKLSKQRLYSAVLFSILGVLNVLHAAGTSGIKLFGIETGFRLSNAFLIISHLLCAAGMLIIFSTSDRQTSGKHKLFVFLGTAWIGATGIVLLYTYRTDLPALLEFQGHPAGKLGLISGILALYAAGIFAILYRHRKERPKATLTVIRAMLFLMMGFTLLMSGNPGNSRLVHVLGEWYTVISYYFVLKGVYHLTIDEPYKGQRAIEAQMKHMAYHDDLTGLPNLRRMKETLNGLLEAGGKSEGVHTGVAVINIDRFKAINDSLGYSAGDKLLMEVGERLKGLCHGDEKVFRMGEDEFAVIFTGPIDESGMEIRAEQLLVSVNPSVMIDDTEYHISLSMGLSVYPEDGNSVDQLIQYADMAVHHAKEHDQVFIRYTEAMKKVTQSRVELENDMRKALERNEFFLEYQPQFSLQSGKMVGMEALVRWNHPKRGLLPPNEFIPLAEDSGLIVPLGEWVLKTACQHNKKWQLDGYEPVCVSVNLSMRQFRQYNLADKVDAILKEVGLESKFLELEITESMTFDIETALNQLQSLKRLGIHISIDDFGTGYSSLNYLKSLPIDRLKIDRSFVKEVMLDGNDAAIVSTITTMAHHLKLKVTAEGVESEEQLEFLKGQNCHEGQGYLFSKPVPARVLESEFLSRLAG